MQDVFKKLERFDAGKVLDAATGRGDFINVIKQRCRSFEQIIGVDCSEAAVSQAEKLFPENNIEIYRMDLEKLSFANGYFNTVCLSTSLHHLEHPDVVLPELMRVLAPGGRFILVEMYRDGKQNQAQQTHIMMHHWFARIDMLNHVYHWETYTRDEILAILDKLPLTDMEVEDYYIPVDNPTDPQMINPMIKQVQDWIRKCRSIPEAEYICCEGNKIIERIKTVGCVAASRLFISANKQKRGQHEKKRQEN